MLSTRLQSDAIPVSGASFHIANLIIVPSTFPRGSGQEALTCYDQEDDIPDGAGQSALEDNMEIEGRNPSPDLEAEAKRPEVAQKPQEVQPSGDSNSRSTSGSKDLSIRSGGSQKLDELVRSAPEIRQALVDEIKREIESGNYDVKAEKIADKMISDGMLHKTK